MSPASAGRLRFRDWPIRRKLLAMVLLPLWVVLPLLGVLLMVGGNAALDGLLVAKVRSDLAVARGYFDRMLTEVGSSTSTVADSQALFQAVQAGDAAALQQLLAHLREREHLDFIQLRHPDGRAWVSDAEVGGAVLPWLPSAAGRPGASVELLHAGELASLSPELRARVPVPLISTRGASPSARQVEDRAMTVMASADVRGPQGSLLAQVQAGVLLNRNLGFIDQLNEIVYPEGALPWGSHGTATLFLEDVRISTNVRLFGGEGAERAIGTRVSSSVRDTVLGRGQTWLDRAFVVQDWYVSGYLPLSDHLGRRVGMLYVGFLEQPFTWLKYGALASTGIIFFAVMLAAAWICLRWARAIFRPLEQMSGTMASLEAGHSSARVGAVPNRDEIGQLADHFDHLLDTLDLKTRDLQQLNSDLDAQVAQRTHELEAAQQHLVRSEKLAAVGQLTAGMAHEINNPIAVIQGNLDLIRELLGPQAAPVQAELGLVDQQIERMRLIVTRLLQFARPGEFAGYVDQVNAGEVQDDCLVLVEHLLQRARIVVRRDYQASRPAQINRQELQQVLVNLLVNALQAMPDGGELLLQTADWGEHGVTLSVADSGPGVPPELLDRLFEPFVTRKPEGTGLGLWISRNLVERYGGDIILRNRPQGGAEVSVYLPGDAPG
jgi:two-component system, NtrC family, sensor kinase